MDLTRLRELEVEHDAELARPSSWQRLMID
jgi:hypothetical protein